jgi:hypothetical protein
MNNMVTNEVYHTPIATSLVVGLFTNKIFFLVIFSTRMEKGHVELLKGEKLNQMLLKFTLVTTLALGL